MANLSKNTRAKLSEQEMDDLVILEASDEAAWEAPVSVNPSKRASETPSERPDAV